MMISSKLRLSAFALGIAGLSAISHAQVFTPQTIPNIAGMAPAQASAQAASAVSSFQTAVVASGLLAKSFNGSVGRNSGLSGFANVLKSDYNAISRFFEVLNETAKAPGGAQVVVDILKDLNDRLVTDTNGATNFLVHVQEAVDKVRKPGTFEKLAKEGCIVPKT